MAGKTKITPRPYQLELLEAAMEENTIVVLGTGTGKTFVSVLLIRELQYQILGSFSTHKRTIFLVTTVPLVAQQAKVVRDNLDVNVGEFKGDSKIDTWNELTWVNKFEQHHVLVMTAQIFVNILSAGFVQLDKINLVIFDECHHATKDHPYCQVMRLFDVLAQSDQQPRVLGLTAALIQGKCRAFEVEKRITQLEKVLQCRAQTSQDLVTVHKFATRPDEHLFTFNSTQDDQRLINVFTAPIQFLADFPKRSKSSIYETVKDLLVDCSEVLEEVGSTILYKLIEECNCLNHIESYRSSAPNPMDTALISLCCTHLKIFKQLYNRSDEIFITSKMKRLLQILEDFGIKNGESTENSSSSIPSKERLCGIIFVQQRSTALALARVLQLLAKTKPHLRYIRCAHIVGHGATQSQNGPIARRADMTTAQQQQVLSCFRSHKINLLVSTSVVEEGLDVPQCNLVIRYSLPDGVCSYLQSRGRARASNSQYIMMVDERHSKSFNAQLRDMQEIEKMLEKLCYGRHVPVVGDEEEDEDSDKVKNVDEIIPPFCPHGEGTQTRATATSSIQSLYMYCQRRLSSDDFYQPVPIFKISIVKSSSLSDSMYDEVMNSSTQYQCTITMPTSCPLLDPIKGHPMDTAKLAKRDASVEAVRQLYNAKELDDNLLPVVDDGGEDEEDSELQDEKKIVDAGTIRRKQKYKVQYAESLTECYPVPNGYLYMIMFRPVGDHRPQGNEDIQSYGIITRQYLPLDDTNITLYHGNEELSVTVDRLDNLIPISSEDMELFTNFHYTLFDKILGLNGAHLETNQLRSSLKRYIVIPITVLTGSADKTALINYELMHQVVRNETTTVKWPCSPAMYDNTLVKVNYRNDIEPVTHTHRLYCVNRVCKDRSPRSSFPDGQWKTYQDFYHSRYGYSFTDPDQPLLEVSHASTRLEHLTRRQCQSSEADDGTKKTLELFPEICDIHPLSVEMYKLARLLPSFLYRMESLMSACELTTAVKLSGYGTGTFTSPSNSLVLQALTLQGAQDNFNMERLELLGDTFLKMITTVSLHSTLPASATVSTVTHRRSAMISNVRLYYLAKKKHIPNKMKATIFKARSMWLPPGYKLNDSKALEYEQIASQVIPDKRVADCVEALAGAYIVEGGIVAGFRFLEWLGFFKMQHSSMTTKNSTSHYKEPLEILLTGDVLGNYFSSSLPERRQRTDSEVKKKLFAGLPKFDKWSFQDKHILLEAVTHISYTHNRVTSSYQRLELLGDAILDYLITSYIYCEYPDYNEGDVSLLRSAIVNNTTLALLAVLNDFHKAVKHHSPKLFSKIQQFTAASIDIVQQLKNRFADVTDFVHYESENDLDGEEDDVDTLDPPKVLADIVESLVGAVFLDSNKNLATVWAIFKPLFHPFIEKFSRKLPVSPVRKLLETDMGGTAKFRKQKCGDQEVECVVKIKGKGIVVSAVASNYKAAKKAASKKALSEL